MIHACIVLALASCAIAGYVGYPTAYTYAAPAVTTYQVPVGAVSAVYPAPAIATVADVPVFGFGNSFPAYGYGFDSYGFGLDGLGGPRLRCVTQEV
ncbi:hypothetical protein MTO96_031126 [Rhipicephalus appendiculatus]